jgi:hypothetical protein
MFGLALVIMGYIGSQGRLNAQRLQAETIQAHQRDLQLTAQIQKVGAVTANERYENGCLPVVNLGGNTPVNLAQGMTVTDPKTKASLPPGTIVCDGNGNTGIISADDHTVQSIAWTGDRKIINDSLTKWTGGKYQQSAITVEVSTNGSN